MTTMDNDLRRWAREEDHAPLQRRNHMSQWLMTSIISLLVVGALVVSLGSLADDKADNLLTERTDLIVNLEGKEESPAPRYKATQFISFTINTFGGLAEHGECNGRDVDGNGVCYLGSNNITEDVTHRALIVRQVLEALKKDIDSEDPEIDHSSQVLKIFAMPEFFWRGPFGAYTTEQIEEVVLQVFDRIREYISDESFKDYLFILGTVIAVKPPDESNVDSLGEAVQEAEYGNFCPVYKGGKDHQHRFLVTKKYISTADFLNRNTLPVCHGNVVFHSFADCGVLIFSLPSHYTES